MSRSLVICDKEDGYASALAMYIVKRKELAFQVQVCSSLADVQAVQGRGAIDVLCIGAEYEWEERSRIEAGKTLVFTVTGQEAIGEEEIAVCKYQSGEMILGTILQCAGEAVEGLFLSRAGRKKVQLIGVYSPVHRIGKTSYALELGKKMAGGAETLYLNMELYGGRGGHFPENPEHTMADLLYYSRQESKNLYLVLSAMTARMGNLDYLAPMPVSADVRSVQAAEWVSLIEQIVGESIYETVILDLDDGIQGLYDILALCTQIHMPKGADDTGQAKVKQLKDELYLLGYEAVWEKITEKGRTS